MRRTYAAVAAAALLAVAGCSGGGDDSSEGAVETSDEAFVDAMDVGDFAALDLDGLDTIATAFCADLANLSADDRSATVIGVRESVDTDLEAYQAARAMAERACPEYAEDFDLN